jgi:hypothetical protein
LQALDKSQIRTHQPEPFGLDWIRAMMPHYARQPFSLLHRELVADLRDMTATRGRRENRIAPRGFAKSTICSKAHPVYSICEGTEAFILILSDSARQARSFLRSIKRELETNKLIAARYPHAAGVGPIWQADHIRTRNGVEVMVAGGGGRVRGMSADERRPTLVIVDDANEKKDAYSADQRQKKIDWLMEDILPMGEPGTNFLCVGTPIHREAIVCSLATKGWATKSYRSIIQWPVNMDLWLQWERALTNLGDAHRSRTARRFYEDNRAAMEEGASLLWPERFDLYDLMSKRAAGGDAAFRSEYQDEPGTSGATEWPSDYFADHIWVNELPHPRDRKYTVQALDPSKGVQDRPGDFQAHACIALGADGLLYFDADFRREDSTRMAERAADLCDLWQSNEVVVETNATMGLLKAEFQELANKGRFSTATVHEQISHDHKSARIREVGAYLARKQVRVVNGAGGRMLVQQWQDWPNGDYDDGPDSAGVALRRLTT